MKRKVRKRHRQAGQKGVGQEGRMKRKVRDVGTSMAKWSKLER